MRRSPDAGPACARVEWCSNHSTERRARHDHPAHRDPDHRGRPGRPLDRLPPAAPRAALPDRGRRRAGRRQLAAPVGHAAPLHAGEVRRPARPAVPGRRPVALPRQGRGGGVPRAVRAALRPAGADEHPDRPARGPVPTAATSPPSARTRSPATTSWWRPAPSAGPRWSRRSPATSIPASGSCTPASTAVPTSSRPGTVLVVGGSHSGMDIAYEAAETHDTILCGRDCGQIPVRLESRRAHVVLPVIRSSCSGTCSPGVRRWAARRCPRCASTAGPACASSRQDLESRGVERVTSRVVGVKDGRPLLDDGRVVDAGDRRLVHRLPAALRLDRAARLRGRRLAGGVPRRRGRRARAATSAG